MKERDYYIVGGCRFYVEGARLPSAVTALPGFRTFGCESGECVFGFSEDVPDNAPRAGKLLFSLFHDGCQMEFSTCADGHILILNKEDDYLKLWHTEPETVRIAGVPDPQMLRFALWIGYGLEAIRHRRIPMHCSCIVKDNRAYLFLGESGTGKSTHTRLWRENIEGAFLLNDDSPIISYEDGQIWVYGSPWSGKTPCYKQEKYRLGGCVRLSQAPYNEMKKLPLLSAFAALHPSCPPQFAGDAGLYDEIGKTLGEVLERTSVWHLKCLPDAAAARLSHDTMTL